MTGMVTDSPASRISAYAGCLRSVAGTMSRPDGETTVLFESLLQLSMVGQQLAEVLDQPELSPAVVEGYIDRWLSAAILAADLVASRPNASRRR
ncbi:MAG TPA: hypothetical protein VK390_09505 [Propionibacteriaceae bacterium]|nr:hypothetical protein [Propionibacteriaceae bacterium]